MLTTAADARVYMWIFRRQHLMRHYVYVYESRDVVKMDGAAWPSFHRAKMMCVTLSVMVLSVCQQHVTAADSVTRLLLSADTGNDECSLQTSSNYTGLCHCSSLLDIHCTGLDQIPHFTSNDRIYSALHMPDQLITDVPQSAVDRLKVRTWLSTHYIALHQSFTVHLSLIHI